MAFAGVIAAGVALSCSSSSPDPAVVDVPDAAAADASVVDAADAGSSCPLPFHYGSPECQSCVEATCCDVVKTCSGEPDCEALQTCAYDCLSQSSDAGGCKTQCEMAHPTGNAQWQKVHACWLVTPEPMGCFLACTTVR